MPVCDRQHGYLRRCYPEWKYTSIVFNQAAHESLERTEHSSVHHDHAMAVTILRNIVHVESLRQVQINLHSWSLPFAPDRIIELDIDFGCVECATALVNVIGHAAC